MFSRSPSASGIPFDNATNSFAATTTQAAIEEARASVVSYSVAFTAAVTTTSATFSQISSMTLTPIAGTYLTIWSGSFAVTNGANGSGELAVFLAGNQQTVTTRTAGINVALLLGLIGTSTTNPGGDSSISTLTVDGSQAISVRFRSVSGDTVQASRGNLILLRIA